MTDLEKGLGLVIPHPHPYLHRVCVVLCCPCMDISACSKPALGAAERAHGWEKLHRSWAIVCTPHCQSSLQIVKGRPESFLEAAPSLGSGSKALRTVHQEHKGTLSGRQGDFRPNSEFSAGAAKA